MALRETADQIFPELARNQRTFLLAGGVGAVLLRPAVIHREAIPVGAAVPEDVIFTVRAGIAVAGVGVAGGRRREAGGERGGDEEPHAARP